MIPFVTKSRVLLAASTGQVPSMADIAPKLEILNCEDDKVMDEQLSQICDVCQKMLDQIDDPNLEKDRRDNSTTHITKAR